jgi:hypothetical protein
MFMSVMMLMLHGAIFPRHKRQHARAATIDAPNWFMAMFSPSTRRFNPVLLRLMMSLDPLTEGGRGYPLLFQTGEAWNGEALHDRQHRTIRRTRSAFAETEQRSQRACLFRLSG